MGRVEDSKHADMVSLKGVLKMWLAKEVSTLGMYKQPGQFVTDLRMDEV